MYPARIPGSLTVLREFTGADLDGALAIVGDPVVTRTLSFDPRTRDEAAAMLDGILARAQLDPRTEYYMAITLPGNEQQVAGFCRLALNGVNAAKLGCALAPWAQGHGYAADANRALIGFGFGSLGLHRISAAAGPDNLPSIRLLKRLGFQHEGRIRDHVHTGGAWRDSELYSLLEHEWDRAASPSPRLPGAEREESPAATGDSCDSHPG